jgi:hypothetical protein
VQSNQQRRDLQVRALASKNFAHHRARLLARERLVVIGNAMESFENHSIQATAEGRFLSNGLCIVMLFQISLPSLNLVKPCAKAIAPTERQSRDIQ